MKSKKIIASIMNGIKSRNINSNITKLTKGKYYQVIVRAYKTVDGKTYYYDENMEQVHSEHVLFDNNDHTKFIPCILFYQSEEK